MIEENHRFNSFLITKNSAWGELLALKGVIYERLVLLVGIFLAPLMSEALRSKEALSIKEYPDKIEATLAEGFHFNDKAPNQLVVLGKVIPPANLSAMRAEFPWLENGKTTQSENRGKKPSGGELQLYVCDNANTYCETHDIKIGKLAAENTPKSVKGVNLKSILKRAQKNRKLVVLDFSARWCPGCVRLESEIFSLPEFKEASKNFELVKVDVDIFGNFPLSKKFSITGIPTLLVLDSSGNVIDRMVDFQPLPVITKFLETIAKDPTPLDKLVKQSKIGREKAGGQSEADKLRLARRLIASDRIAEALAILEIVTPRPPELIAAKVTLARRNFEKSSQSQSDSKLANEGLAKNNFIAVLKEALSQESNSLRSLTWRADLIGLLGPDSSAAKQLVAEGKEKAESWLLDEGKISGAISGVMSSAMSGSINAALKVALKDEDVGEYAGYERLLVATSLGELLEAAGKPPEEAWKQAIEVGESYNLTGNQPGPARRFLLLLIQAKEFAKAEALSKELLRVEPSNFDVRRRQLKILSSLNRHEESLKLAEVLLNEAEGRNQFWVAESLAKSYLALNKKKEARVLLDQFLGRKELDLEAMAKTKKDLQNLRSKTE